VLSISKRSKWKIMEKTGMGKVKEKKKKEREKKGGRLKVYFSAPDIQGIFKMSMMCVLRQEADYYINQECI
jgi:hypothetical protein